MLNSLNNFDPVSFLDINTPNLSGEQLGSLRNDLNSRVGEYILLRSSKHLTLEQLEEITNMKGQQMIDTIQKYIPDIDNKIPGWLNDFKNEYKKQLGGE